MVWLRSIFAIGKGLFSRYLTGIIVVSISALLAAYYIQISVLNKTIDRQAESIDQKQTELLNLKITMENQNTAINNLVAESQAAGLYNDEITAANQREQIRSKQAETKARRRLDAAIADNDCAKTPPPQNIKDAF